MLKNDAFISNRFVLIDAFALIHRAFHALPPLTNKDGVQLNAVYGFTSALLSSIDKLQPEYLACAFDLPKPTKRHLEYIEYKAHRAPTPDELVSQIPYVKEILKTFNIPIVAAEGYEGEDVIATIIRKTENRKQKTDMEFIIVTGDLDCLQLVDDSTNVYSMARGVNQAVLYDEEKVRERYGLTPSQFVDFKALKGDASDNIPGVKGIGEKTAINLIQKFGSLEKVYREIEGHSEAQVEESPANAGSSIRERSFATARDDTKKLSENAKISEKNIRLLLEQKEQAFLSQKLSKIDNSAPIDFRLNDAKIHDYDKEKVKKLFLELGFKSLVSRLPEEKREDSQQKLL